MLTHLFLTPLAGRDPIAVTTALYTPTGLVGHRPCLPLRQVLVMPAQTLHRLGLDPGILRENMVLAAPSLPDLHQLPSGTILQVGTAQIHLTFHCEPCQKHQRVVPSAALHHQRGFLGRFLNQGQLQVGDSVALLGQGFAPIPYEPHARIVWYLDQHPGPVTAETLLPQIGLGPSYLRTLPSLLAQLSPAYQARISSP